MTSERIFHHEFRGTRNPSALMERMTALKAELSTLAFAVAMQTGNPGLEHTADVAAKLVQQINREVDDFLAAMGVEEAETIRRDTLSRTVSELQAEEAQPVTRVGFRDFGEPELLAQYAATPEPPEPKGEPVDEPWGFLHAQNDDARFALRELVNDFGRRFGPEDELLPCKRQPAVAIRLAMRVLGMP